MAGYVVPIFVPYMYPYVSTFTKNVRGGHRNLKFAKNAKKKKKKKPIPKISKNGLLCSFAPFVTSMAYLASLVCLIVL
jgi:hypothetical protein